MPEVVSIGETMTMFAPAASGPLRYVHQFSKHTGGAESNVCIGLVRLGHSAGWVSRLGDDEFGRYVLAFVRGEGVDTSQVRFDPGAPTAVYFKERSELGDARVFYYRAGSAASRMGPQDLDPAYVRQARVLHLTGITPALSSSCHELVRSAIKIARQAGVLISFDPNLRLKLWDLERAREVLIPLMREADLLFPGWDEARLLLGAETPEEAAQQALDWGCAVVAVKLGAAGALVAGGQSMVRVPGFPVPRVVDPVGAGDAFAAGFLAGYLEGMPPEACARLANAAGAYATTVVGDVEGLPTRPDLERFAGERAADLGR